MILFATWTAKSPKKFDIVDILVYHCNGGETKNGEEKQFSRFCFWDFWEFVVLPIFGGFCESQFFKSETCSFWGFYSEK